MDQKTEMKNLAQRLSKNLYIIMGDKGRIKATELSKKSGVSAVTIGKIRNDSNGEETPKLETIVKLATALDIDAVELLK